MSSARSSSRAATWLPRKLLHPRRHIRAKRPPSKLTPPQSTIETIQSYVQPLTKSLQNPSALLNRAPAANNPQSFLARVRAQDSATIRQVGIVTAEVIGFFSIGEMIGRFKIVGYRSDAAHAHH